MNEEQKDRFFDLLTTKAIYGLTEEEQKELEQLDPGTADSEFLSLERTAAAVSLIGLDQDEPLPQRLFARISAEAEKHVGVSESSADVVIETGIGAADRDVEGRETSWFGWLGWAVAAAACIALAINIWLPRTAPLETAQQTVATPTPRTLSPAEQREEMLRSAPDVVKADWAAGNVKELKQVSGDVVWSDQMQAGYMRFRGLAPNNPSTETYQLWIFDQTQDKATPIDGGTFSVSSDGEVIVPINAKLKAQSPEMFAVTIEQPGGVVVSKREKIAVLGKVEAKPPTGA